MAERKPRSDKGHPRPETMDAFFERFSALPDATREVVMHALPPIHRALIAAKVPLVPQPTLPEMEAHE